MSGIAALLTIVAKPVPMNEQTKSLEYLMVRIGGLTEEQKKCTAGSL
jgi:hypothetical protein